MAYITIRRLEAETGELIVSGIEQRRPWREGGNETFPCSRQKCEWSLLHRVHCQTNQ